MQLRERLNRVAGAAPAAPRVMEPALPPGVILGQTAFGPVAFRDEFFPVDFRHGQIELASALECDSGLLERLGVTAEQLAHAAFLDIETTGLSGGTGTYAFLIGVGTFDSLSFRVRQFFLIDPSAERAMLAALVETIERCRCVVTFNGKSFDLPQLSTRFAMSRLEDPFVGLHHVDLLHPARRLYSHLLPSSRLAEIERHLMGVRRYGDISGSLIPAMYFSYIRRRNIRGLPPIFEHNSLDVLSLVGLIGYLNQTLVNQEIEDGELLLALGRWDESRGQEAEARYEAARLASGGPASGEATWRLCRLLKRRGQWRECIPLWELEADSEDVARRVRALVELSKLAEHRERKLAKALELAQAASQHIEHCRFPAKFVETKAALDRRLERLNQRISRNTR